jgi:hypothetical protein
MLLEGIDWRRPERTWQPPMAVRTRLNTLCAARHARPIPYDHCVTNSLNPIRSLTSRTQRVIIANALIDGGLVLTDPLVFTNPVHMLKGANDFLVFGLHRP